MKIAGANYKYISGLLILAICLLCSRSAIAADSGTEVTPEPEASKALVAERLEREREVKDDRSVLLAWAFRKSRDVDALPVRDLDVVALWRHRIGGCDPAPPQGSNRALLSRLTRETTCRDW